MADENIEAVDADRDVDQPKTVPTDDKPVETNSEKPKAAGEDQVNKGGDDPKTDKPKKDDPEKASEPAGIELTFPEGVNVDETVLKDFKATVTEMGLNSDQSQKLVDLQAQLVVRQQEAFADMLKGWADESKDDKEIGGEAHDENIAGARRALNRFGTPQLREVLNSTGMGNHPEVVRAFVRIGKAMGDGRFVSAGQQAGKRDPADILFGDNND